MSRISCKFLLCTLSISLKNSFDHFYKTEKLLKSANKKYMLIFVLILITDNACLCLSLITWHCTNQWMTETQALTHVN